MGETSAAEKRKRVDEGENGENNIGMDDLPDEILIAILSRMSIKEAGRTSVLSRRWRYLWRFISESLCFDAMNNDTGKMESEKFIAWVDRVLELHQSPQLDKFIVRFKCPKTIKDEILDRWVFFAMRKEVKDFELQLESNSWLFPYYMFISYKFPNMEKLLAVKSAFGSLRSIALTFVHVEDEVVHHILASCSHLEVLRIYGSFYTENLHVVDPLPNLKLLEIVGCHRIRSVEISAMSLVSFSFEGHEKLSRVSYKNIPNLSELSLLGGSAASFIYEAHKHSSYSAQLTKLSLAILPRMCRGGPISLDPPQLPSLERLELVICPQEGERLSYFTSLLRGAPLLREFKIGLKYKSEKCWWQSTDYVPYPVVSEEATAFRHKNLKLVEMAGYHGSEMEDKFLLQLYKCARSMEKLVIDTKGVHFHWDIPTETPPMVRVRARNCATNLKSKIRRRRVQLVII